MQNYCFLQVLLVKAVQGLGQRRESGKGCLLAMEGAASCRGAGVGAGGGGDWRQLHLETNKHRYQVHLGLLLMRKERLFPKRQVHLGPSLSSAPAPRSNRYWFQSQRRHFTPVSKRRQASVCSPIKWASHLSQVLFERIKLN